MSETPRCRLYISNGNNKMVLFREYPSGEEDTSSLRKVLQPFDLVRTSLARSGVQINWAGGLENGKIIYQTYLSNNVSLYMIENGGADDRVCKSLLHIIYETLILFTGNVDFCTSDRNLSASIADNSRRAGGAISGILRGFCDGSIQFSSIIMSYKISLLSKTDYIKIERLMDDIVSDGNVIQMCCLLCTTHGSIVSRLFGYHPAEKINVNLLHWMLSIIIPSLQDATIRDIPVFIPLVDGRSEAMRIIAVKIDKHNTIINLCPQTSQVSTGQVAGICCDKFNILLKSKWGSSVSRSIFHDCGKLPDKVRLPNDISTLVVFSLPSPMKVGYKYDSCSNQYWSLPLVNELNESVDSPSFPYVVLGSGCSEELLSETALQIIDLFNQPMPTMSSLPSEKQPVITSGSFYFDSRISCVWTLLLRQDSSSCRVAAGYLNPVGTLNQKVIATSISEFISKNKKIFKTLDDPAIVTVQVHVRIEGQLTSSNTLGSAASKVGRRGSEKQSTVAATSAPSGGGGTGNKKDSAGAQAPKLFISKRYEANRPVGSGAYGQVWSAIDLQNPPPEGKSTKGNVAVKKITNPFSHRTDAKRLMREILLLSTLKHPNVLGVRDMVMHSKETEISLFIITDLMDVDLHKIIQSPQPLSERHIQFFIYQILSGLKYIHSAGLLHRDIKPSNILLNEDCQLRICDFGLARPIPRKSTEEHKAQGSKSRFMTEYVVTRWYRSPELLLQEKYYTTAIDVWSAGCILAEMLGRKPLFPGQDYIEQLICITQICGTPSGDDLASIGSEQAQKFVKSLEDRKPVPLRAVYPKATQPAIDLLSTMLQFNYNRRITIDDALSHPYIAKYHSMYDEPTADKRFLFEYDGMTLSQNQMKEIVMREVVKFQPELDADYQDVHNQNIENGECLPQPLPEKIGEDAPIIKKDENRRNSETPKPAEATPATQSSTAVKDVKETKPVVAETGKPTETPVPAPTDSKPAA